MCSRLDTSWEVEINKASWRFWSVFLSQALDKKTRSLRWNECLGLHFASMWSKVLFSRIQQKCCMQNQLAIHRHTACVRRRDRGANPYPRVEAGGLSYNERQTFWLPRMFLESSERFWKTSCFVKKELKRPHQTDPTHPFTPTTADLFSIQSWGSVWVYCSTEKKSVILKHLYTLQNWKVF